MMIKILKTCKNPLRRIQFIDKILNFLYYIAKKIILSIKFYREKNTIKFKQENPNVILLNPHNLLNLFYNSDYGEDHFIYKHFFKNDKNSKKRIYFDIGANHPIQSNNTYFFEKKGWGGYAFEPNPELEKLWKKRKAKFFLCVLSNKKSDSVPLYSYDSNHSTLHKELVSEYLNFEKGNWKEFTVKSTTVNDICSKENISTIDLISIDVDGHELEVLQGIDFDKIKIQVFIIEYGLLREKIFNYLTKRNFIFYARTYLNDIYVHSDFLKSIKE